MKNKPEDKEADGTLFALELTEAVDFDILSEHGLPAIIDYGPIPASRVKKWLQR